MRSGVMFLLHALEVSRRLLIESVADFSAAELSRRPTEVHRSCTQILGMAAVADREAIDRLEPEDIPDVPMGFEARFARWGTGEEDGISVYDHLLPAIFSAHRSTLIRMVTAADPSRLDEPVWPPDYLDEDQCFRFETVGGLIAAVSSYTAFLVGELASVRSALGKAAIDDPFDLATGTFAERSAAKSGRNGSDREGCR